MNTIRKEYVGMLPAAIQKFEELLALPGLPAIKPFVAKGYDHAAGQDSYFHWGVACRIAVAPDDRAILRAQSEALGITWLSDDGDMAYTNGLDIDDFKTYRVSGSLELTPEEE
jgi:hypothetical protein